LTEIGNWEIDTLFVQKTIPGKKIKSTGIEREYKKYLIESVNL